MPTSSSSSIGATARCGLWPVEKYLSIFPYLSPPLSIVSLPALEDLFLLLLSLLSSSSLPFQFLSEDLFGHPILLHSLQETQPIYPLPLYPFYYISLLLNSSSSRFVLLFHSPSSYFGPYIILNIFLSKINRACSSFFVIVHVPLHMLLSVLLVLSVKLPKPNLRNIRYADAHIRHVSV